MASLSKFLIAICSSALLSQMANAGSGLTYQGRILKPDGTPLVGSATQFKIQIRAPDSGQCLMYEELQTLNLSQSNGSFSLTIHENTGTRTDDRRYGFDRIFGNSASFDFDPSVCTGSSTYIPTVDDGRLLVVLFKDETMSAWEPIPAQKLNYVPFAISAKEVAGFPVTSLVRVAESDGTLTAVSPLSNSAYTELLALLNGTSTSFGKLGGTPLPTMTSGQVLGWNGTTWVSTNPVPTASAGVPGQVLTTNGSGTFSWSSNITGSASTITSVLSAAQQAGPSIITKSSAYVITASDIANKTTILADTSGGSFTLTLPDPTTVGTQLLTVIDKAGSFSVNPLSLSPNGSEKIAGLNASLVLRAANGSYAFQSDGSNWYKVSAARNSAKLKFVAGGTWVAPSGVANVMLFGRGGSGGGGAGGGGGGGSTSAGARGGGAGGGGGAAITVSRAVDVVPGTSYAILVGAGGAGGTGGAGAIATSTGAIGTAGTTGAIGGDTKFGSLITFKGAQLSYQLTNAATAGGLSTTGAGGNVGRGILQLNCATSGGGGGAGAVGTGGSALGSLSPFGASSAGGVGAGGATGGTGGGGGGGGSGPCPAGDGPTGQNGAAGGDGGASGLPGNNGANGVDGVDGSPGTGGGGGGGGGLLSGTGTAGGGGGNGGKGSDGYILIQWSE